MRVRVWCDVRGRRVYSCVCVHRCQYNAPRSNGKNVLEFALVQNRWRDAHGLPLTIGKAPSAAPPFSFAVERHQINEIK